MKSLEFPLDSDLGKRFIVIRDIGKRWAPYDAKFADLTSLYQFYKGKEVMCVVELYELEDMCFMLNETEDHIKKIIDHFKIRIYE